MYYVYGGKIDKYSCNKGEYFISVSHVIFLIPPQSEKGKEPEDKHCVSQCT